jgi:hypothetical protein
VETQHPRLHQLQLLLPASHCCFWTAHLPALLLPILQPACQRQETHQQSLLCLLFLTYSSHRPR